MARWLIPWIGILVVVAAVAVGAVIWTQQGDTATCDHDVLVQALRDGISTAEAQGKDAFEIERPAGCSEQDQADAVPEVTRNWHMMPGGMMMREATHPG